jgi:hypothetical protein
MRGPAGPRARSGLLKTEPGWARLARPTRAELGRARSDRAGAGRGGSVDLVGEVDDLLERLIGPGRAGLIGPVRAGPGRAGPIRTGSVDLVGEDGALDDLLEHLDQALLRDLEALLPLVRLR